MTEIYLENNILDLSAELSHLITFQIDDIKSIGTRETSYSKTIIIPGTTRNNKLFAHYFDASVSNQYDDSLPNVGINFNPAVTAECKIFFDSLRICKGTLRLLEVVINNGVPEYECAFLGELGGLSAAIGNGKLENLDLSEHDHIYNYENVTGSWDNFNGSGVVYPLIDYGNVSTDKIDYDIRTFRPAISVREYLDKIIRNAGYTYECDLFETERFKKLIVPNNQARLQRQTTILMNTDRAFVYRALNGALNPPPTINPPQYLKFINFTSNFFTANGDINEFTYTGSDPLSTTLNIEFSGSFTGQFFTLHSKLLKNGSLFYAFPDVSGPGSSSIPFTHQVSDLPCNLVNGDVFKIEFTLTNNGGGFNNWILDITEGVWDFRNSVPVWADIPYGVTLDVNSTIPRNVAQIDFLSSVLKLFNLYVYEDNFREKRLIIKPFVDFYDFNSSGIVDWTYKMDRGSTIRYTPMSELNARYFEFRFKPDGDYYNETYRKRYNENYGDYTLDSQFHFVQDRSTIDVIFSGSPLVGYSGADKIVTAIYKLNVGVEENYASNIRILQSKKVTGVTPWAIKDEFTTLIGGLTDYYYAGHYDDPDAPANDIQFGVPKEVFFIVVSGSPNVTQFNVYWSSYMAEITDKDSRLLSAKFYLKANDIYNLNFSKPIYLDGNYWRLNRVIDWNVTEPDLTKCELLKVINTVY